MFTLSRVTKISSKILEDNKGRPFKLVGIPDLVAKFDSNEYGVIDFKTTKISDDKAELYKFQLESYATIFENPGETNSVKTPLIKPIYKLGILQFDPNYIENKNLENCNIKFNLSYVELKNRITNKLLERVTFAIDILRMEHPPRINKNCSDCNFFMKQLKL